MSQAITRLLTERSQYQRVLIGLRDCSEEDRIAHCRNLCLTDLFFLLVYGLGRPDADNDFVFARCREVQEAPDGHLDLWSREHYKSSIITCALTIQDVLNDPEVTFGIFSHTRPIAKAFLRQIKREFEANDRLKEWFPDVLWSNPRKEAPKWSEDDGIIVKRKGNPKESTVEAWGLVDGQPTGKHFKKLLYDDVVTKESVTTPEMIEKTTDAWGLSTNLGTANGARRIAGTRYHFNDTYKTILSREAAKLRLYAATVDGTVDGEPVLMTREALAKKRTDMGPYIFGSQMLLDPTADETQGFKEQWLRYYKNVSRDGMNLCILVDAASEKKKSSDYTSMEVLGFNTDQNIYTVDMIRDRLNLSQRTEALFALHRKWKPDRVGYEKYGLMADVEHMRAEMERRNYRFAITDLGGPMPKPDRIKRLMPYFEQGRLWLPETLYRTDYQGRMVDLTKAFVEEEYKAFPFGLHDDMLDSKSRMLDLYPGELPFPMQDQPDWNSGAGRPMTGGDAWLRM